MRKGIKTKCCVGILVSFKINAQNLNLHWTSPFWIVQVCVEIYGFRVLLECPFNVMYDKIQMGKRVLDYKLQLLECRKELPQLQNQQLHKHLLIKE